MKPGSWKLMLLGAVLLISGIFLIALRELVVSPMVQKTLAIESHGKDSVRYKGDGSYHSTNLGAMDVWQGIIIVVGGLSFISGLAIIGILATSHRLNTIMNDQSSINR